MQKLPQMTDLALDPVDTDSFLQQISDEKRYPAGMCISLGKEQLEKVGLDDDCEVGDHLHMSCIARVTGVHKSDRDVTINLQIVMISVHDEESEEDKPVEIENVKKIPRFNPYGK